MATASLPLNYPSSLMISGATGSGKTQFSFKMLQERNALYQDSENKTWNILYCYSVYQPLYDIMEDTIPQIVFKPGLPTDDDINDVLVEGPGERRLLILDDMAEEVFTSQKMRKVFTQDMHHKQIATILMTQNLFLQNKYARTIALNCTYIVIFRNARDESQIKTLAGQIAPDASRAVQAAYKDAVSKPYGYLFIDVSPNSISKYKLRTNIFPSDKYLVIYKII